MFREAFIKAAGGVFRSSKSWSRLSSENKFDEFWSFFEHAENRSLSIYAGIRIEELLRHGNHSVEHIVPKALLEFELARAPKTIKRGATVNPLNFAASHRKTNTHRGHAIFDFDEDAIHQKSELDLLSVSTEYTGLDHQGEWVVPPRSRGDIARAVLYMFLVYPLPRLQPENARALIDWHRSDAPSNLEREYNLWVWKRKSICNPFIENRGGPPLAFTVNDLFSSLVEKTKS